ncbi:Uncharacterised protein [Chryseobacterium nakagawai]|nr:Uncharacterised protein [Chryseobacterium nakagawai]
MATLFTLTAICALESTLNLAILTNQKIIEGNIFQLMSFFSQVSLISVINTVKIRI